MAIIHTLIMLSINDACFVSGKDKENEKLLLKSNKNIKLICLQSKEKTKIKQQQKKKKKEKKRTTQNTKKKKKKKKKKTTKKQNKTKQKKEINK